MKYNVIIFGTRPELLKVVPIIQEIKNRDICAKYKIICTGQHKELIEELLKKFDVIPDITLPLNNYNLSLSETLSILLKEIQLFVSNEKENIGYIMAQGDTTSCLAAAMVSYLNKIPFAHIEAGLRTYDLKKPFPEEYFRRIISLSTKIHFTPTTTAKFNLIKEGINEEKIIITGNTIIDLIENLKDKPYKTDNKQIENFLNSKNNILITCHRRENQNNNFIKLISTIKDLALSFPELNFLWLWSKNPFVLASLQNDSFSSISNISIIDPVNIFDMIHLYKSSKLIITDSGGIQEEAISFSVPTIVIREETERKEAINVGNSILVGNSSEKIKDAFRSLINIPHNIAINHFGDGKASIRIIDYFERSDVAKIDSHNILADLSQENCCK